MTIKQNNRQRGALINPQNRFEGTSAEFDYADFEYLRDEEDPSAERNLKTTTIIDHSKSILTKNDSPDIGFNFSVNPYRGCEHGCAYCYARPTHETLGMNAGLDFESKIMVKVDAPMLLEKELRKKSWRPEPINFSGVTDCYQPLERRFRLTRQCLEVLLKFRNPATIVSKNVLVLRDIDVLEEMAKHKLIQVLISVTTLKPELAKIMEPRTATPQARIAAVKTLNSRGVPTGVIAAPMIPALNDIELPAILKAAAEANANCAFYTMLRLPLNVRPIFVDWLEHHFPEKSDHVLALLTEARGGKLNDPNFGSRMKGQGVYAATMAKSYKIFSEKYGLRGKDKGFADLDVSKFSLPEMRSQRLLFPDEG